MVILSQMRFSGSGPRSEPLKPLFHSSQKPTRKLAARTFIQSEYLKALAVGFCDEWKRRLSSRIVDTFSTYRSNNEMFTLLLCVCVIKQFTGTNVFVIFHSVGQQGGRDKQEDCPNRKHHTVLVGKKLIQQRSALYN